MYQEIKSQFVFIYNSKVPNWKKIYKKDLVYHRNLIMALSKIEKFIIDNKLNIFRLVESVINDYLKNYNRYPSIFLFQGKQALTTYYNYKIRPEVDLTDLQKIIISVKSSKKSSKISSFMALLYTEGVKFLLQQEKIDPYFLLAFGKREFIDKKYIKRWEYDDNLKLAVLSAILAD